MTFPHVLALLACFSALVLLVALMRANRLQEKYAAIWIAVVAGICVLGAFPRLLTIMASWLGLVVPANLLFVAAFVVVFLIAIQLSTELSKRQEDIRDVAEALALAKVRIDMIESKLASTSCDAAVHDAPEDEAPNASQ